MQELSTHTALIWLLLSVFFIFLEIAFSYFGFLFVSFSCLFAGLAAAQNWQLLFQLCVFAATLFFGLMFLRPRFVKKILHAKGVPHRTSELVGKLAHITTLANSNEELGRVNVEGQDWAMRIENLESKNNLDLKIGEPVRILGSDGIVLIVSRIENEN